MGMGQAIDSASIIGKSIKIGKLVVAQYDFPDKMNWKEAKATCASLGKGWRLPTRVELNTLYQKRAKIGGFAKYYYWSSTEDDLNGAWFQDFNDGFQFDATVSSPVYVRAIRAF